MAASPQNRSTQGGGRPLVLFLLVAAVVLATALLAAYYRRPPLAAPQHLQPASDAAISPKKLPKIPFRQIAREAGIDFVHQGGATGEKMLPESGGSGCAFVDYDRDGDPDLILVSGRSWPWREPQPSSSNALALYRNDAARFTNVTSEAGLIADIYGQGVAVGDYDADGDDDLFFTAVGGTRMFRNDAGRFTDVSAETGLSGSPDDWTTSAGFFDYDRDGDLDLFVCNYVRWTREIDRAATRRVPGEGLTYAHPANFAGSQNYLYRNDGGQFTDVSAAAGIHVTDPQTGAAVGKALAVTFADFDSDGWLDIFVANDTVRHFLFHNQGDGTFEEVGQSRGFALNAAGLTTSGMGVDAAWIFNDRRLALAMGNFATEMTSLYILQGKDDLFFSDETIRAGIGGPTRDVLTFGLLFDDLDLDGRVDLVETNGHLEETITAAQPDQRYRQPAKLFWNSGADEQPPFIDLPPEDIADLATPIVGRAIASADIDGDGDLDLVINQVAGPPLLLRNDQQQRHHWLRCQLEGPAGNPHAIGAVIELKAGGTTQRREIHPTRGYLAQTEPIATFGLGNGAAVESLTVTWPDGTKQQAEVSAVDRLVTLRQQKGEESTTSVAAPLPASFSTLANIAKAQLENGEFERAIPALKQALELRPGSAAMRRNLARAYTLSGQPALALEELERLRAAAQPSAAIEYLSGLAEMRQLHNQAAAEHFRKAIELDPNDSTLRYQYGLALTALGRADEASQQFAKAAELDPLHGGAQYQLAMIARKAGQQQAFARYMRDYQRIRAIKGPADPLSLEENRYTKAEPPETAAKPAPIITVPQAKFVVAEPTRTESTGLSNLAGAAVLSMDDAGRYQWVGVSADGNLTVFDYSQQGGFQQIARTGQPIGSVGERAIVLVGNAFVDANAHSTGSANLQKNRQGDQAEIAIVTPQRTWLVRYEPGSGFEDLTAASNLSAAAGHAARWVDLDHDGDIDLCVASSAGLHVWRNNGDGTFVDATGDFGLAGVGPCIDFAAADFDATNLGVDLVIAGPNGSSLYRNQYAGRFARDESIGPAWPAAERVLVDDFNNDGSPDAVFLSAAAATLIVPSQTDRQQLALGLEQIDAATTIDVDNDGWLDVAVAGRDGSGPKSVLLRNVGGRFEDAAAALPAPVEVRRAGLADADLNGDGRTDLLVAGSDGRLVPLLNETPTENRQLKLALRSFVGSPSSIGVRVQLRSGELVVTRWTNRELPIELGVGQHTKADSVQTLWMNGVARNEVGVALTEGPLRITIVEFVRTSSCPFLYASVDGAWQFVTDLLGTAPLNVSAARNVPLPLDPDEVVVLGPAERFADGDSAARLRITSELREAVYLDQAQLLAVDHPADTTVFSLDHVAPTAVAGIQMIAGRNPVPPGSAIGSDGIDRTAALAKEDGLIAPPARVLPPPAVGFTAPLAIELDFGELDDKRPQLLALTGWFRFGNSSTNIAASQRGDLQAIWPRLEAAGADGRWQIVEQFVGFPAGNTKTIVCDLTGKLPPAARRLRLTTSFEVRWDRIALYEALPPEAIRVTPLPPVTADLQWQGFAELRPTADDQPQVPNLARRSDASPWLTVVEGWCTRYGDVRPLLVAADPMLAVLNSGDGATIEFSSASLPPRKPGASRTLLLYTRGWIKEADSNTLPDRRIEPLPVTGFSEEETVPDWQLQFNTRWVPSRGAPVQAPMTP